MVEILSYSIDVVSNSHDKVVWFNVTVDNVLGVDVIQALNHLNSQHEDRLQRKPLTTADEQVLKGWTKEIQHEHIVIILFP